MTSKSITVSSDLTNTGSSQTSMNGEKTHRGSFYEAELPNLSLHTSDQTTSERPVDEAILNEYFEYFNILRRSYLPGDVVVWKPITSHAHYPFWTAYCCIIEMRKNEDNNSISYLIFDGFEKLIVPAIELYPSFWMNNIDEFDALDILKSNHWDIDQSKHQLQSRVTSRETSTVFNEESMNTIFKNVKKEYEHYKIALLSTYSDINVPPDVTSLLNRINSRYDFSEQADIIKSFVTRIYYNCGLSVDDYNPKSKEAKVIFVENLLEACGRLNRLKYIFRLSVLISLHRKGNTEASTHTFIPLIFGLLLRTFRC